LPDPHATTARTLPRDAGRSSSYGARGGA
jgi:hypothetical protein